VVRAFYKNGVLNVNLKTLLTIFLTVSLAISCAKVNFNNSPSAACAAGDSCTSDASGETITKSLVVPYPNNKVDILFVVDNSRTMIDEQSKMATRLQGFLNSISSLDYRIAITTTDNAGANRTDLYSPQDYRGGALVPFLTSSSGSSYATDGSGKIYYITKSTPNAATLFYNTVKRPESTWCSSNQSSCPSVISGDERGIYSAVKNVGASFIRSDAQLHVVVISDEDERSNGGGFSGMTIEAGKDRPEDLLNALRALNKRTRVHSIVGLPYGFNYNGFNFDSCVNAQIGNTSGQEYVGCYYLKSSVDSGGIVGNKDTSDYTSILSAIGSDIQDTSIKRYTFNCVPTEIKISMNGGNAQSYSSYGQNYIDFNPALAPGTTAVITWKCPRT
jgi:hypothetical protein